MVIINKEKSPIRKIISAVFSNRALGFLVFRMDKNERILLVMNITIETAMS